MSQIPTEFSELVLQHTQCTHAALDAAKAELEKTASVQKRVETELPGVIQILTEAGIATPAEREKCASILRDPVRTLALLSRVAESYKQAQAGSNAPPTLGKPTTKSASANPTGKRPQDLAYERRLRGEV